MRASKQELRLSNKKAAQDRKRLSLSNVRLCATKGQKDFLSWDTVKVKGNRTLVFYREQRYDHEPNENSIKNLESGAAGQYNGDMSRATRSHTQQILNNWMMAIQADKHRTKGTGPKLHRHFPRCVTLTLADKQKHSDNYIKRHYLGAFIKRMQRKFNVEFYFWRAESQANGNIHFHVVLDHYVPRQKLTIEWNEVQNEYVESYYRKKESQGIIAGAPPSTHIELIKSWTAWSEYVTKYATKESEGGRRKIEGRIWGCSKELKALKSMKLSVNETARYDLEKDLQAVQGYKLDFHKVEDHCVVVKLSKKAWHHCFTVRKSMYNHFCEQYENLYGGHIDPDNLILQRKKERGERFKRVNDFKIQNFVYQRSILNSYAYV